MHFQRARSDKQIQDRIDEIISAASEIYNQSGYEGLNFSAISELTDFTRPAIYKYFSTKEEILLQILTNDIYVWINELTSSFRLNKVYTTKDISVIWAHSVATQKRMNELHSILFTILEQNASKEAVVRFKKALFDNADELAKLLIQLFPNAENAAITNFISIQYALAVGYYPMCHMNPTQIEAMHTVYAGYTSPDFETGYQTALYQIMLPLEEKDEN